MRRVFEPESFGDGDPSGGSGMWPDIDSLNIHIRLGRTDMRKQIDSLAAPVEQGMGKRPFTGELFLFCGRAVTDDAQSPLLGS